LRWRNGFLFRGQSGNFRCHGRTQARGALLRFGLPVGAAKPFGCRQIPSTSVIIATCGFEVPSEFEGHHGVARFRKKRGKLAGRIFARAGSANARGNLLPVTHKLNAF
jgi:hypothetical protein